MPQFNNSSLYWEERYKNNGNSGAGSYGQLAEFKASVINRFIKEFGIQSVIEFGCGDGNQLTLLEVKDYTGFDISSSAVELCREKFKHEKTKRFYHTREYTTHLAELVLSLDVVYHLIEDEAYQEYMYNLFSSATRFVIIYSSNVNRPSAAKHVKHRCFTNWVDNIEEWELFRTVKNQYPAKSDNSKEGSFADFYIFRKII